MPTLNEAKYAALEAQTGLVDATLNEHEYKWLLDQCGDSPVNPPSEDPNVVWYGDEFTNIDEDSGQFADANLYFYERTQVPLNPADSACGYWFPEGVTAYQPVIGAAVTPFGLNEYIVKYEVVQVITGDGDITLNYTSGRENEWWELYRCNIQISSDNVGGEANQECLIDVTVATYQSGDPAAGTAVPVPGSESTRRVRMIANSGVV